MILMRCVIGLAGLGGSGKSEVSAYLAGKGFAIFGFSNVLREEAESKGLLKGLSYEQQKYVFSKMGEQKRKESGMGVMADILIKRIESENVEKAVADGFLSPEEVTDVQKKIRQELLPDTRGCQRRDKVPEEEGRGPGRRLGKLPEKEQGKHRIHGSRQGIGNG